MMTTGRRGVQAVCEYTELLMDYTISAWTEVKFNDEDEKFEASLLMLSSAVEAWFQLVFKSMAPRCQIFEVCHLGGAYHYDQGRVQRLAGQFDHKRVACDKCFDKEFTDIVVTELLNPRTCKQMHNVLCKIQLVLRNSSVLAERAHIPAQETKGPKRRGLALLLDRLGQVTYHKYVR